MKSILKFTLSIVLALTLCVPTTQQAYAYKLDFYKMDSQIWYQAWGGFKEETREGLRQSMRNWNNYLPEWRRVCYNTNVHWDNYHPSDNDG